MDQTLLLAANTSFANHYLTYRTHRARCRIDLGSVLATLEAAGTIALAGSEVLLTSDLQYAQDIRGAVMGLRHMTMDDVMSALEGTPDERESKLDFRDWIWLVLTGAKALMGKSLHLDDEMLSSLDAFDALVAPTLTQAERDKHAWIASTRQDWRRGDLT